MDHNQLTTFDRIVREGSFSRAARELHIAQPTISARIHALEEEVGGALLTRTNHGVQLTALGVSFLPYARQALAAMLEGIEAARQARSGLRGRITIGSLGSLTGYWRQPWFVFRRRIPRLNVMPVLPITCPWCACCMTALSSWR